MKKYSIIFLLSFLIIHNIFPQAGNEKIVIAKYILYPYSTEYFDHDSETPSDTKSFDIALRRTKKFKYTLMSDFMSKDATFTLDTLITTPIKGKESYWIEPENVIYFGYKHEGDYYKKETIFKNVFYVNNTSDFSFEWEITNEHKTIAGLNCTKAISTVKNNRIIAWFTSEIPITYSPFNLNGLPGLILEVETFFNTITIESISYSEDIRSLVQKKEELIKEFEQEKDDNEIKESILMLKKAQLINQLKMMR